MRTASGRCGEFHWLGIVAAVQITDEIRMTYQVRQALADILGHAQMQQAAGSLVEPADFAHLIHQHHAIRHGCRGFADFAQQLHELALALALAPALLIVMFKNAVPYTPGTRRVEAPPVTE